MKIADLIATLMTNDQSPGSFAKPCRDIYEKVVANRLLKGVTWLQRSHLSSEYSEFKIEKLHPSASLPKFNEMKEGTLYHPRKENYSLVDLIFKQNEKFIGIQVSRSTKDRSIKPTTVIDFLKDNDIYGEDFIFYYCPSPQFANSAKIILLEYEKKNEVDDRGFNKVSYNILKVPEDYGIKVSYCRCSFY